MSSNEPIEFNRRLLFDDGEVFAHGMTYAFMDGDIIKPYLLSKGILMTDIMWSDLPPYIKSERKTLHGWYTAIVVHLAVYALETPFQV